MTHPGEFRSWGHEIVDQLADYFDNIESKQLFPDVRPEKLFQLFDEKLPQTAEEPSMVMKELEEKLFPYCTHVGHPGYFGLITPSPNPVGILADLIAAAYNQNIGAYSIGPSAVAMERQTVRWLCQLAGYGNESGGNLTSGGMMANFTGMKLARDWASNDDVQQHGVTKKMTAYTSEERHVSVDKSADAIGIGRKNLKIISTDDKLSMRLDILEAAIKEDKANGCQPFCIVGMGGTTNTGSVDDIIALRKIANREKMWLHIDAAYGGGMFVSQKNPGILKGIEQADSITIDPHKWFYAPLDAGAILVRDEKRLTDSFGMEPSYLTDQMDKKKERYNYFVHSFEQSRRFRSLKVWMSFKRYGIKQIGEWIDTNCEQAQHLYDLFISTKKFIPVCKPLMSAICARFYEPGLSKEDLHELHIEVARRVEESGKFWFGTTQIKGYTWFRINPVNFRTRMEHIDDLFAFLQKECLGYLEKTKKDQPATNL
jgi:glutamate/tyrosine decarboxylase-like PLP-dependent enzyme